MVRINSLIKLFVIVLISISISFAQQDTTLVITSGGNVGVGITNPAQKLHVNGSLQLEKTTEAVDRLLLKTASLNDPGRYGIRFLNNIVAPFEGEDIGNMYFALFSAWGATRTYDAILEIHGKATGNWGTFLQLTHDGTNGKINTDVGHIILNPASGSSNVGIGVTNPSSKLEVNGSIKSVSGGYVFPDGTTQATSAAGVWKQTSISAALTSTFSDPATINITPPCNSGYFVLTFSGSAYNNSASNQTNIGVYLTNAPNSGSSYAGYISYFQDSSSGYTRTIPLHATRFFTNTNTSAKNFYVHAGDNYDGGYTLYGMFTVQWFPGTQQ